MTKLARRLDRSPALGRLLDICGSVAGLALMSPVLLVVAAGVRLTLGSPVIFRQVRAGRNGRLFTILKFRTMEMRDAACCEDPQRCRGLQMAAGVRMSRFAAVIRRVGLDELPQLVNILRGDMSFIGPRPLLPRYLGRYTAEQARRHDVRPGITGWAQVKGRTDLEWNERLALDVWYVDHASRRLDVEIARLTFRAAILGSGYSQVGSDTGLEFLGTGVAEGMCPATGLPVARGTGRVVGATADHAGGRVDASANPANGAR